MNLQKKTRVHSLTKKPNQNQTKIKNPHTVRQREIAEGPSHIILFLISTKKKIYLMTFVKDFHSLRSSFMEANSHACLFQLSWEQVHDTKVF